ncbi:hypothetical protein TVAG_325030 [Trichomonas vaginalis G3]|uniref:Uncharacterized protein n=1 Tax=Trichomonas vaginalis (strain ATCC PRA-98 / G3) TaxID=412133 RepID=A2F138_TRIV3|nr:guanine nucleotide exchange c9orf72 family [Trichomonas vaginalis G3]EAY01389.1 hypothetical protein TVAG_325030 [Trichomonas vaginalis G3]KAI5497461.1 guanine nucleotide exchange c9orf72 family [Trichomonas vaginalis G3]|eukprot:XP_001330237.1 hypothetical protein [Trichomonas vaginalis G3]
MITSKILIGKPNPFQAVTLVASNFQTGFEILGVWNFSNQTEEVDYQSYNRIVMSGVTRHDQEHFAKNPSFFFDFPENKLLLFGNFFPSITEPNQTYALTFFVHSEENMITKTQIPYFHSFLALLIHNVQEIIKSGEHFLQATPHITLFCTIALKLLLSGVQQPTKFPLTADKCNFFLQHCLASHLQTQMTTIIESKDENLAKTYFDFLSLFLTKEQLNLSSKLYTNRVTPGLFLQIVSPQTVGFPPSDLYCYDRPWTWINLDKEEVIQGPDQSIQTSVYQDIMLKFLDSPQMLEEFKLSRPRFSDNCCAFKLVQQLKSVNDMEKYILCMDFFGDIIRKAILMAELVENMKSESGIIQPEVKQEILSLLNITDKSDLIIIGNISSFFDQRVARRLIYGRRDLFNQIYAAV